MKKFLKGLLKGVLGLGKVVAIFLAICIAAGGIGNFLSRRVEKKYENANKMTTSSVDNNDNQLSSNIQREEDKVVIKENVERDNQKNIERGHKEILESRYFYVSGPIVRNNKKYWKVRLQGIPEYGLVDDETLLEVIPCGKYDLIGNETSIDGKNYVPVSIPLDDGYAYGLLSLDNFTEVIPCGVYRDVDINKAEEVVECLQKDRETVDIYQPDENSRILTKTFSQKVQ